MCVLVIAVNCNHRGPISHGPCRLHTAPVAECVAFNARKLTSTTALMLVSHCSEYMANGLTNAVRHEFVMIANDRQTFVAVRKHSRSLLWCFECYAGLTSGECMANGLTNAIRHQFAMIAK